MKNYIYPAVIKTYEEYDKILQYNEERSNRDDFNWFLKQTPSAQFVYVQDYKMSNNFIIHVYSKVRQEVRDNILKINTLLKKVLIRLIRIKLIGKFFVVFNLLLQILI